jgi:alpha-beta hydrolase superfamily lysophospholipase
MDHLFIIFVIVDIVICIKRFLFSSAILFCSLVHTFVQVVPLLASQVLAARAGSAEKYLRVYLGGFHEMFEDPDQALYFQDVLTFLEGVRR